MRSSTSRWPKALTVCDEVRKIPIEHTGFYPYIRQYLEAYALEGYSDATTYRHESNIRQLAARCEQRGIDQPSQVTKPVLDRYRKHLYYLRKADGQPLSFTSQKAMLIAIKGFFRWLTQQNHLLYNPASERET
mgnify:CR=1 FL=1